MAFDHPPYLLVRRDYEQSDEMAVYDHWLVIAWFGHASFREACNMAMLREHIEHEHQSRLEIAVAVVDDYEDGDRKGWWVLVDPAVNLDYVEHLLNCIAEFGFVSEEGMDLLLAPEIKRRWRAATIPERLAWLSAGWGDLVAPDAALEDEPPDEVWSEIADTIV